MPTADQNHRVPLSTTPVRLTLAQLADLQARGLIERIGLDVYTSVEGVMRRLVVHSEQRRSS